MRIPTAGNHLLATASFLALSANLTTGLVFPILPLFARSLGTGYSGAGLLVSAFYGARLICDLPAGVIVNRWGLRRSTVVGFITLALGALLTAISGQYWLAVGSWAFAGVGSALVYAAMFSSLLQSAPQDRMGRALSIFYAAFNSGLVLGGVLGSFVAARFGIAAPLAVLAGGALVTAVVSSFALAPLKPPGTGANDQSPYSSIRGLIEVMRLPGVWPPVIALFAELWGVGAVLTLVPLFGRDVLNVPTSRLGPLLAIFLVGELAMLYPAGRLTDLKGGRWVLAPSLGFSAAMFLVLGWVPSLAVFVALFIVLSIANGFVGVPPAGLLAAVVPQGSAGVGAGLFRLGGDLGFALGPVTVAFVAGANGFGPSFAVAGMPSLVALVLVVRWQGQRPA